MLLAPASWLQARVQPKTRERYWQNKFKANVVRDRRNETALLDLGWKVMVIWECETKDHEAVAARIESFLRRDDSEPVGGWGV